VHKNRVSAALNITSLTYLFTESYLSSSSDFVICTVVLGICEILLPAYYLRLMSVADDATTINVLFCADYQNTKSVYTDE